MLACSNLIKRVSNVLIQWEIRVKCSQTAQCTSKIRVQPQNVPLQNIYLQIVYLRCVFLTVCPFHKIIFLLKTLCKRPFGCIPVWGGFRAFYSNMCYPILASHATNNIENRFTWLVQEGPQYLDSGPGGFFSSLSVSWQLHNWNWLRVGNGFISLHVFNAYGQIEFVSSFNYLANSYIQYSMYRM